MATQTQEKEVRELPKGCMWAKAPDGETDIIVRIPRPAGTYFRVKHRGYGARTVRADTEAEALKAFFAEFNPSMAGDAEWCRESMRLNDGRVVKVQSGPAEQKPQQQSKAR